MSVPLHPLMSFNWHSVCLADCQYQLLTVLFDLTTNGTVSETYCGGLISLVGVSLQGEKVLLSLLLLLLLLQGWLQSLHLLLQRCNLRNTKITVVTERVPQPKVQILNALQKLFMTDSLICLKDSVSHVNHNGPAHAESVQHLLKCRSLCCLRMKQQHRTDTKQWLLKELFPLFPHQKEEGR